MISVSKTRIYTFIVVLLYISSFIWGYVMWICPTWEYIGFRNNPSYNNNYPHLLMVILFCVFPILWIPIDIKRPSMILYWILYLLTYIPMIVGVSLSIYFNLIDILIFDFFALVSIFFTGISYYLKLFKIKSLDISNKAFWVFFITTSFLLLVYCIFLFKDNLTLFNFLSSSSSDLYDFRFSGRDIEAQNPFVGYLIMWLSGAFFPFLFANGILFKKRVFTIFAILGQILLYATMANKAFVISLFFMWLVYKMLKNKFSFGILFSLFLFLATFFLSLSQIYFSDLFKFIFMPISSLFLIRTIGTSSLTANLYYDFFRSNPNTYYSHISIINKFVNYPYGDDMLGVVIGNEYTNIARYNINANFFITDGIAAFGVFGMPLIAILCSLLFYFIDSVSNKHNLVFTSIIFSYAGLNIMNVSLFTSFISGGIFLTLLFLLVYKSKKVI